MALDRHECAAAILMDLSKAFPHIGSLLQSWRHMDSPLEQLTKHILA